MYQITGECIGCGLCQSTCPQEAISMGAEHRQINQEKCIQCGTCFEGCPVEAIEEA
jgi:formate hydrogenlyase subunit 6/NADH:ubiquinone oxidoreductase subunit I